MYRISFSINFQEPFIWKGFNGISKLKRANLLLNLLADFDLGKDVTSEIEGNNASVMIKSYKAYRRNLGLNHPSLITDSYGFIEKFNEESQEWAYIDEDEFEYLIEQEEIN